MIEAELPDGTILEFPEGTSQDVIQNVVRQRIGVSPQKLAPNVMTREAYLEAVEKRKGEKPLFGRGSTISDIAGGIVKGATDIGTTLITPIDMALGNTQSWSNPERRQSVTDFFQNSAGIDVNSLGYAGGRIASNVAGTAGVPAVMARGAQVAGASAPIVTALRSGGFVSPGTSSTLANAALRTGAGAAVGGASAGLVNPEDAGMGVIIGGALPAASKGAVAAGRATGNVIKGMVEPFYKGGQDKIIGRALTELSGKDAATAIANLKNAQELVPGSIPTVGQASGVPSLAALERASIAISPEAKNALTNRIAMQNEARVSALRNIAGTKATQEAAKSARQEAANSAYEMARNSDLMRRELAIADQIAKDAKYTGLGSLANAPVRNEAQSAAMAIRPTKALEDLAKRPSFAGFINDAKKLAANKGIDIGNPLTSIDGLHYLKLSIDDALEPSATNALGRNAKSALVDMKNKLVEEMDKISPVYSVSRKAYQQASKPINQMAIGEELMQSVRPLDQQIIPTQFAKKLTDETAQAATGFKGATLENVLEPEQLNALNAIKDDLARAEFAKNAGTGVGSNTVQNLAYSNMINQAGIPNALQQFGPSNFVGNVAKRFGDVVYGRANNELSNQLAETMLDPYTAAALMEAVKQKNSQSLTTLANVLRRGAIAAPVMATSGP
jgi:hypothetical protein